MMSKKHLTQTIVLAAIPRGYVYQSGSFYKTHDQMIVIITLQKLNKSSGIDVDIGCCPLAWWKGTLPPNAAHGGLRTFAAQIEERKLQQVFEEIGRGGEPGQIESAIEHLLNWIDNNLLNRERVVRDILDADDIIARTGFFTLQMKEWAIAQGQ